MTQRINREGQDFCAVCKAEIVAHSGRWWHIGAASSTLPRALDPFPADRDNDHDPVPERP